MNGDRMDIAIVCMWFVCLFLFCVAYFPYLLGVYYGTVEFWILIVLVCQCLKC